MRRDGPDPADMPMPADVYAEHQRRRRLAARPDPLHPVPRREPSGTTDPLAAELLAEAATRALESGELLLVSEEASLADLEAAVATAAPAGGMPDVPADQPVLSVLAAPRLMSLRVWEIMDWQPPLAEHMRLLEAALFAGTTLPQVMLVGHVETFVERVEHLVRLRDLLTVAADAGGGVVLAVQPAAPTDLPAATPELTAILDEARPAGADVDVRHAVAIARLALGSGVVRF